jgi:ubiquinone/menaquinone biosynthesis C-methylase UbiE
MNCAGYIDYLHSAESDSFDFILISHSLYRISLNNWIEVLDNSKRCLTKNGIICVVLRQKRSRLWEHFNEAVYGYASDLLGDSNLFAEDIPETYLNSALIDSSEHLTMLANEEEMFRFIEYLYRIPMGSIKQNQEFKSSIKSLASEFYAGSKYYFGFSDSIILLQK